MTGYGAEFPETAMLMEPDVPYDAEARKKMQLTIPVKDLAFAKDLADRMGWKLE